MEMKIEENQGFMEVLKRATKLLCGNIDLALFLFLCSLPLFCFLIFFELSLQTTVSLASRYLSRQLNIWGYYYVPESHALSEDLIPLLIQTFLLYLSLYSLVDLLTTTMTVSASSIVYTSEEEPRRFIQLVKRSVQICQNKVGGCLITSLYVLLLSTSVFFGFFFVATNYFYIISLMGLDDYSYYRYIIYLGEGEDGVYNENSSFHDPEKVLFNSVMALFHCAILIVLLAKFSKWSAGWNMGLVVSVLEEGEDGQGIYGADALTLSAYYGRGQEKRGHEVMLVFLIFALTMRMPCLCFKCNESSRGNRMLYTSLYVGLICIGNVIKWVACVVCYYDCRTRILEKKGDVEIGSKAKAFAT